MQSPAEWCQCVHRALVVKAKDGEDAPRILRTDWWGRRQKMRKGRETNGRKAIKRLIYSRFWNRKDIQKINQRKSYEKLSCVFSLQKHKLQIELVQQCFDLDAVVTQSTTSSGMFTKLNYDFQSIFEYHLISWVFLLLKQIIWLT